MNGLPLNINLRGWPVAVAGNGRMAARRARTFSSKGADVFVFSESPCPALKSVVASLSLHHQPAAFESMSPMGPFKLIAVASKDRALHAAAQAETAARGGLLSLHGNLEASDFSMGALSEHPPYRVAVFSDGTSPRTAIELRDELAEWMEGVTRQPPPQLALEPARSADGDSTDESFPAVSLVGAGPGDPGLLTLRARARLNAADIVLVDALVPPALYTDIGATIVQCGKRAGGTRTDQSTIHRWMIDAATQGLRVVRLKGGDPGVFGRLHEELEALEAAGVRCEVVPGISSALAGPLASFGGLTGRDTASGFTVLTATRALDASPTALPSFDPEHSLVVLMGTRKLDELSRRLVEAGYPYDWPAAAITEVSRPGESIHAATVGTLGKLGQLPRPGILVFGAVVLRARGRAMPTASRPARSLESVAVSVHEASESMPMMDG